MKSSSTVDLLWSRSTVFPSAASVSCTTPACGSSLRAGLPSSANAAQHLHSNPAHRTSPCHRQAGNLFLEAKVPDLGQGGAVRALSVFPPRSSASSCAVNKARTEGQLLLTLDAFTLSFSPGPCLCSYVCTQAQPLGSNLDSNPLI